MDEDEYVCADIEKAARERAQQPKEEGSQPGKTKPYFGASSGTTAEASNPDISSMSGFLSHRQMDMLKPLPKKRAYSEVGEEVDERDPSHVDDYYSECYAGYAMDASTRLTRSLCCRCVALSLSASRCASTLDADLR